MRAPKIDFLPSRSGRRLPIAWMVLCVVISALFCYEALSNWRQARKLDQKNLELARRVNQRAAERGLQEQAADKSLLPYLADAQGLAKAANFPIQQALHALESIQVTGVKLNSVDIRADQGSVELSLEFSDYKALLTYLDALNAGEPATRWKLRRATTSVGGLGQAAIFAAW